MTRYFKRPSIDVDNQSNEVTLYEKVEYDANADMTYVERKTETITVVCSKIGEYKEDKVQSYSDGLKEEDWEEIRRDEYDDIVCTEYEE